MKNKSLNLKTKQLFKKAVSLITAAVMVFTILPLQPITAYAEGTPEGYTYDAGSSTYTVSTFDGLATALAAGGNIVLNNDITKDNPNAETPVPAGVTAVLDLNGKTITLAYGVGTIYDVISVYGNLTIKDSATGGTIDASANSVAGALSCESGSTLTIESGTYKAGDTSSAIVIYGGNIDIKGGAFCGGNSLWVSDDADIDIYGGTFENDLIINYGTTDIHGGVIKCLVIDSQEIDSVTIHGGQIDELYDNNNAPLLIKGGTFGFDPSQYIDRQNYKVGDGGENKYTVECLHNDIKGGIVTPNNNGTHTFECAVCEKTINEECYGGTASCTEKAVCTVCSTAYGQPNGHSFGADNVCTVCGLTGGYCGAATNEGGVESLLWTLSDGTLTISGNGAMADYDWSDNHAPWFNHRNDITKAVVNSGVTTIGDNAFTSCTVMTKCQIPETVTSIGEAAFIYCDALQQVNIPQGVTVIEADTFFSCDALENITIPAGITAISHDAFTYCKALTAINVDAANTAYKSVGGVLFTKDDSTLVKYPEGKTATEYTIPSTVRTIGDLAFFAAENLEKVIIPDSVTAIGKETFGNCVSLTEITIPASVKEIGAIAFWGCTSLTEITFRSSDITVESDAFIYCNTLTTVNVPCDWFEITYQFADTVTMNYVHIYDNGFCTICDGYQPAVLTADKYDLDKDGEKDSVYEIGNAGQLYWFIDFVGNGNYHAYAVLTDDIVVNEGDVYGCNGTKAEGWREWTPVNYSGVFDGQGHTVSGIYCNVSSPYDVGFIGFLYCDSDYAAVQNLGVVNSYFNGRRTGGIAGKVQQKNSRNIAKVVNCYSQVYLIGGETAGAIVGQLWDGTVENCYSYGENAAGVAGYAGSYANVINCYYNKDLYKGSAIWSNNGTTDRVKDKTTQQFASGEVAYLLQGSQTERVWGQDIDNGNPAQPYPVFAGAQVNYGHRNCGDIEKTYTNSAVSDTAFEHTDITYSATGNVITATCGACTKAAGTVTVIGFNKVYDGGEHGLITVEATGTMAGGTYIVTYTGENYNSTTAPSAAGEYTASVTVGGATASDSFIIYPAELTTDMFELTYPSSLVYDGNAKTVTATVKDGFTGVGSILVKYYDENGDLVTEAVNAGKYTVKLSVSEGENYMATQEPIYPTDGAAWEFEITKATPTATAPTDNQLTYDGTAQALVTAGTTDGGKFVYSLYENGQYSETIPTGSAAGEYTVWYYIVADENHFDSAKSFVEVVIAKADQQIEIKDIPATVIYGDAFKLSAQLGEGSMDTLWSIESGADNATIDGNGNIAVTGAGNFTVTLTSHGKQNYSDKTVSHTFTAQKKQLTVAEVIAEDKFYNGKTDATIEEITLRGILNEDSVVALGTAQFADKNAGVAKPVTITGLTLKGSAAENYTLDVTTVETTADIIPALIKVAPKAGQSKAYGTADSEFAYEITAGRLYGDDKLTGALGREEGETVGEYAYTIGTLANPDYNITFETADKFEIVKGTPEYTAPTGLSATYGDTLAKVKLPEGWAWKDETTTSVGNIGENKFTAIFTPADTANYNTVEVELTIKVNAKPAEKPVHTHSWSGLKNDSASHYYECACGAKDEVTAHTYNTSGRCTVCGYYNANAVAKPVVTPTTAPTATLQPTEKPAEMPTEADTTITQAKPTEEAVEAAKDNVTVSEGTAQLDKEAVEAVADAQSEEKEIVLPLAQTTENVVNEAEIDTEALAKIAKDGKDVVIQFTDATVKLEAEAVKALTEQAKGSTIEIRAVIVEAHTLNEHQQEELKDTDHVVIISVQVFSDGEYIGQFRGGKATVMLPFQLDPGTKAEEYRVYYIDEKGDLHKVASEYIDGYMVFTTVHFSEYIIAHEAAQNDDTDVVTPQQPEQETFPVLPVIMAIAAVIIILIILKKKREEKE